MNFDLEIDMIRLICAFFSGALFSLSGSFTQLVSENDLASPSTFGFDALAILIMMSWYLLEEFSISQTSLLVIVGVLSLICLVLIRKRRGLNKIKVKDFILIGLAFNLFVGSIFSVIQFLFIALNFQFPTDLWFGGFRFASFAQLSSIIIMFVLVYGFIYLNRSILSVMSISKNMAVMLKGNTSNLSALLILISLVVTVVLVSCFGVFSFLALIFPHILRQIPYFKKSFLREVLIGPFVCGLLLMVLDLFSVSFIILGAEVPTGMLSSMIGSFIFIGLLVKSQYKDFAKVR